MLSTDVSAFKRFAFLLAFTKASDHSLVIPLLSTVIVVRLRINPRGDERPSPTTKSVFGSGSEGAVFQADIRPHKRFSGFLSLPDRFQQLLSVVFSGAFYESVLKIDSRSHKRLSPRAKVQARGFVEPPIALHIVCRA